MAEDFNIVNRAFSKQSTHYDADDAANPILCRWRQRVYQHAFKYLKPGDHILELNAGTGIDAYYFAQKGFRVHATDLSTGMVDAMKMKAAHPGAARRLTCEQLSYDALDKIGPQKFDFVFSNFGGLNCIEDLSRVTRHLPSLMNPGGHVTWVIMPKISMWELASSLRGRWHHALRRFQKNGTIAHLEGEHFKTFYHSLAAIKKAFGSGFELVDAAGLGNFSPPPHSVGLAKKFPLLTRILESVDIMLGRFFPFSKTGDHVIVTFRYSHQ